MTLTSLFTVTGLFNSIRINLLFRYFWSDQIIPALKWRDFLLFLCKEFCDEFLRRLRGLARYINQQNIIASVERTHYKQIKQKSLKCAIIQG